MAGFAQCSHIFGVSSTVANAPIFQDEQTLLLAAGGQMVRYRLDDMPQKFVANHNQQTNKGIASAIAVTSTRRHLAVAETLSDGNHPHIIIYDLMHDSSKRQRVLNMPLEVNFREIVSLDFSPDGKYLIAQGGAPDWIVCMWLWEKNKLVSTIKTTNPAGNKISQISFNPYDSTQVAVTGDHIFKYLRFTEGNLKQMGTQKIDPKNYTAHCWLSSEKLVLACENGRAYIVENGDVKETINLDDSDVRAASAQSRQSENSDFDHRQSVGGSVKAVALATVGSGFAVSNNQGMTYFFEAEENKTHANTYHLAKKIVIEDKNLDKKDYIIRLTASPANELLVGLSEDRSLYQFSLATAHLESGQESSWEVLGSGSHSGPILDLSVCSRKPLVGTCGQDNTLKIWNYESHECEISKRFPEDMLSISLHPSGLHVLVGFSDKLRLLNLLIDDVRLFREFPIRGCRLSSFSNGGHLFAVVHGLVIMVFSNNNFEVIQNLQGHSSKIRCLSWSPNDQILVSCGGDGAIYQWNPATGQRIYEVVNRGVDYTSVTMNREGKIWASSSDGMIREINNGDVLRQVKSDLPINTLGLSNKLLFGATKNGTVRCISQPLTDPVEFTEFTGHSEQITTLVSTQDGRNIITASTDGSIIVWNSYERDQKTVDRQAQEGFSQWAEEVLVSRTDLEEKNREVVELKTRVEELKMENEYQLRLKDMSYNDKMKELTEKFVQEMEALKLKNQHLKTDKEKQASTFEEELNRIHDSHDREIVDLEQSNNQKLMFEYERYQELQAKTQKQQTQYEHKLQALEDDKNTAIERLSSNYENRISELTNHLKQHEEEKRQSQREFEEHRKQIEEDADREIVEMRQKYEKRLRESSEQNMQLKGESGILNKKFSSLGKEIDGHKQDKRRLQTEKEKLENVIRSLEKDIQALRKEIQERDETIQDKEKRIYDLKKKNQELEKFKFVLDYKIKECE